MKHKLLPILLAAVVAICLSSGLAACAHTHTFATEWSKDESGHWHAATCGHAEEKEDFTAHNYEDGKCTECNYEHASHAFVYSNKTETGHTGTCSV